MSASARSPSRRFSHLLPQHFLLVYAVTAVVEKMFPRLGRPASATAPPEFVIVSVSKPL